MTARVEAERAIADVLLAHERAETITPEGWFLCDCLDPSMRLTAAEVWAKDNRAKHRAHVASVLADLMAERQAEAWDEGHEDGCIAAHCYTQRGQSYFDESKLTDCHTRNPFRPDPKGTRDE